MPKYMYADGFNVPLVSLTLMAPQPQGDPVEPVQRNYAVSGQVHDEGGVAVWNWNALASGGQYAALMTALGLDNAETNQMTIYTRNSRMGWTRYNAIATLPEMGVDAKWDNYFPKSVVVRFTHLVALVEP